MLKPTSARAHKICGKIYIEVNSWPELYRCTHTNLKKFWRLLSRADAKLLRDELWKIEEIEEWKKISHSEAPKGYRRRYPFDQESAESDADCSYTDEKALFRRSRIPRERRAGDQGRPSLDLSPYEALAHHNEAQKKWYRLNKEKVLEDQRKRRQKAKAERAESQAAD